MRKILAAISAMALVVALYAWEEDNVKAAVVNDWKMAAAGAIPEWC